MTAASQPTVHRVALGVNIDHVATLRQARRVDYPDPLEAARLAARGGADGITVHLREDRRHIQDADVERLRAGISLKLNLEMAATREMTAIACRVHPDDVCLVPERREELTTEGGLAVAGNERVLAPLISALRDADIRVSAFVDPDRKQIEGALRAGATAVELHTGRYCDASDPGSVRRELDALGGAAEHARSLGLVVNAGHGLTVANVAPIAGLPGLRELNIGHSIVARAVLVGMEAAVAEMRAAIDAATGGRGA